MTLRELWKGQADLRVVAPVSYANEESFLRARPEDSQPEDAELVEPGEFSGHSISKDSPKTGFTHFLDGAQKALRCGYAGMNPVFLAHTSAAIVERCEREVLSPVEDRYDFALELFATQPLPCPPEIKLRVVSPSDLSTGIANEELLTKEISQSRENRETKLGRKFEGGSLLVDGGIGKVVADKPETLIVGMVKSHQRQYFQSAERIRVIMGLESGDRSSVFKRTGLYEREKDVASFYLRLRTDPHQGPLFGLVRIELPLEERFVKMADEIAGWILHERAPLSLPDARFDRMLYPIRLVEKHLKARQPSDAALRAFVGL